LSKTKGPFQHCVAEVHVRITEGYEGRWMKHNRLHSVESDGHLRMEVWIYVSIMCLSCFVWLLWIWYDIHVHPTAFFLCDSDLL